METTTLHLDDAHSAVVAGVLGIPPFAQIYGSGAAPEAHCYLPASYCIRTATEATAMRSAARAFAQTVGHEVGHAAVVRAATALRRIAEAGDPLLAAALGELVDVMERGDTFVRDLNVRL